MDPALTAVTENSIEPAAAWLDRPGCPTRDAKQL
jgi:hypothetical protein